MYEETTPSSGNQEEGRTEERATISHCLRIGRIFGLLVEPTPLGADGTNNSTSREWRRVRVVRFNEERGAEWWKGVEELELTIR